MSHTYTCLDVEADNAVLDGRDHALTVAESARAYGAALGMPTPDQFGEAVVVTGGRSNITIANLSFEGFDSGIRATGGADLSVVNVARQTFRVYPHVCEPPPPATTYKDVAPVPLQALMEWSDLATAQKYTCSSGTERLMRCVESITGRTTQPSLNISALDTEDEFIRTAIRTPGLPQ